MFASMKKNKKDMMLAALVESNLNVAIACSKIGLPGQTYYSWLKHDSEFTDKVIEIGDKKSLFIKVLSHTHGNIAMAAKIVGITARAHNIRCKNDLKYRESVNKILWSYSSLGIIEFHKELTTFMIRNEMFREEKRSVIPKKCGIPMPVFLAFVNNASVNFKEYAKTTHDCMVSNNHNFTTKFYF